MAELRFPIIAGLLVRKRIIAEIKNAAFVAGLEIDVEEDKGLIESTYRIKVRGEENELKEFYNSIKTWAKSVNAEISD